MGTCTTYRLPAVWRAVIAPGGCATTPLVAATDPAAPPVSAAELDAAVAALLTEGFTAP
jgi:hypothetical protein